MFGKKTSGKQGMAQEQNALNTISRGTVIIGKLVTKGDMRIEGKLIGSLVCDAKLVIGKHGVIEGTVEARNAYVEGTVNGTVLVGELLQLQETAIISGDIYTQKLSVQVGASFSGNCRMGAISKDLLQKLHQEADQGAETALKNSLNPDTSNGTATSMSSSDERQKENAA